MNIPWENRHEEESDDDPHFPASSLKDEEARTESDLHDPGDNDDEVPTQRQPARNLGQEFFPGPAQMRETCEEKKKAKDDSK